MVDHASKLSTPRVECSRFTMAPHACASSTIAVVHGASRNSHSARHTRCSDTPLAVKLLDLRTHFL